MSSLPPPLPDDRPARRGGGRRVSPRLIAVMSGAVLVIALVIGIVVASGDDGGDKPARIPSGDAAVALRRLLGAPISNPSSGCPFGSIAAIAAGLQDQIGFFLPMTDQAATRDVGVAGAATAIQCSAASPDQRLRNATTLYVYGSEVPPGKYQDYLSGTLLKGFEAKVEKAQAFNGGQIYAFCVPARADAKAGCGADWVADDDDLVIGMQAAVGTVTAKQITAALERELADLADHLAAGVSKPTAD